MRARTEFENLSLEGGLLVGELLGALGVGLLGLALLLEDYALALGLRGHELLDPLLEELGLALEDRRDRQRRRVCLRDGRRGCQALRKKIDFFLFVSRG